MKQDQYASANATEELIRIGKLPTALALAEGLEKTMQWPLHGKAADELRRLHALNAELLEALKVITNDVTDRFDMQSQSTNPGMKWAVNKASAAIAKAEAA